MKVNDIVQPISNMYTLTSGCCEYDYAICVSVDPFILISKNGDMRWDNSNINNYKSLCQASEHATRKAFKRLQDDRKARISMKPKDVYKMCIVKGCTNRTDGGTFVGHICFPCNEMLETGKIGPTKSFLGDLKKSNDMYKSLFHKIANVVDKF